jgi:hypothetical protein
MGGQIMLNNRDKDLEGLSPKAKEICVFYRDLRDELIQKRLEMEQYLAKIEKILAEQKAKSNGS